MALETHLESIILHKVACFVWLLAKEVVLTQDNLMKKGIPLCSRCFFCGETAETMVHLFIRCKVTSQLWRLFLCLKNISWSMPGKITEALHSWDEAGIHDKNRNNWSCTCSYMVDNMEGEEP